MAALDFSDAKPAPLDAGGTADVIKLPGSQYDVYVDSDYNIYLQNGEGLLDLIYSVPAPAVDYFENEDFVYVLTPFSAVIDSGIAALVRGETLDLQEPDVDVKVFVIDP